MIDHILFLEENAISIALYRMSLKVAMFLLAYSWDKLLPDVVGKRYFAIQLIIVHVDNSINFKTEEESNYNTIIRS